MQSNTGDSQTEVTMMKCSVHNPLVKEFYLNIVIGKRSASTDAKQTTAFLSEREVQFGSFPMGKKKERKVTLKNTGNAPLVIPVRH